MEVNTNFSTSGVGGSLPARTSKPAAKPAPAGVSFDRSSDLDGVVQNLPASRPDAVARAQQLIADPNYPSSDILSSVSKLLASNLVSSAE